MFKLTTKKHLFIYVLASILLVSMFLVFYLENTTRVSKAECSIDGTLENEYFLGQEVIIPNCTFEINSESIPATYEVVLPNGTVIGSNKFFVDQTGLYTIRYSAKKDNKVYFNEKQFSVFNYLYEVVGGGKVSYGAEEKLNACNGLKVSLTDGSIFKLNKKVNLNSIDFEEPFLKMHITPETTGVPELERIFIKVTDAYDENNFFAIELKYFSNRTTSATEAGVFGYINDFTTVCTEHRKAQQEFNRFVKAHEKKGKQVRKIAMMVGKYDGMDCFSTGRVYGQKKDYWKYSTPEESWDLLKVFYPQAKIGAIYHFVSKGGNSNLRGKDEKFLKAWPDLYGGNALDYQPLGYYSSTPYGVIDLISSDAKNLSDYLFIFLTGWNSCNEQQLKRFCNYLEQGGTLMLCKPHLYDSFERESVLTGKASVIKSEYVDKLLSYEKSGNLIYFDKDAYPIEFKEEYVKELQKAGEKYSSNILTDSDAVSFAEYERENGARCFYLINIRWWNNEPVSIKLKLLNSEYDLTFNDNDMKLIGVSPDKNTAVLVESLDVDISYIDNKKVVLKGIGKAKVTVFNIDGVSVIEKTVDGEKVVEF